MKTNAMKLLLNEHEIIAASKKFIETIDKLWEKDEASYEQKCKQLLDFFKIYSDEYRHHKEENILFPALKEETDDRGKRRAIRED